MATKMHAYEMEVRDVLFMRDARPMEASDVGLGANWPRPDQLHGALHAALVRQWPELQEWESADGKAHTFRDKRENALKRDGRANKDKNAESSFRFGGLSVNGPYPSFGGEMYAPCPLDIGMKIVKCEGTDLPMPLTHAFLPCEEGKTKLPGWIPLSKFREYLEKSPEEFWNKKEILLEEKALWGADRNVGIAVDPGSGTVKEHQLYQAEYLRLNPGVSIKFEARCETKKRGGDGAATDVFARDDAPCEMIFGGQQGVVRTKECPAPDWPKPEIKSRYVRWTLISPAVFARGWLPGWCVDSRKDVEREPEGTVMLTDRKGGKAFKARPKIIAARVGKPMAFSGWDAQKDAPKATVFAVPAGSAYVFECADAEDANLLAGLLNMRARSDRFGEKGYGYGICSGLPEEDFQR